MLPCIATFAIVLYLCTMKRILFVCLGNICRSPMAETIMRKIVDEAGRTHDFEIDSAGLISYHEGEEADPRMKSHAWQHGYRITHLSRPVRESDFRHFDLIVGMDDANIDRLRRLSPDLGTDAKIHQISEFFLSHADDHVPDPYYGGSQGFEHVIDLLEDACQGILQLDN